MYLTLENISLSTQNLRKEIEDLTTEGVLTDSQKAVLDTLDDTTLENEIITRAYGSDAFMDAISDVKWNAIQSLLRTHE